MRTNQLFPSWFTKQKLSRKLAVGCAGLFILGFLGSISALALRQLSPASKIENTSANAPLIVDVTKLLGAPIQQVESVLGSPSRIETVVTTEPQDEIEKAEGFPDGGNYELRIYPIGSYLIEVDFNKRGIAQRLNIEMGWAEDHYSLNQWDIILKRLGLDAIETQPSIAPGYRGWTNVDGYSIRIKAEMMSSVSDVTIFTTP